MYFPSSGPSQRPNPQTALAEPELVPHAPIRIRVEKAVRARSSAAANIGKKVCHVLILQFGIQTRSPGTGIIANSPCQDSISNPSKCHAVCL